MPAIVEREMAEFYATDEDIHVAAEAGGDALSLLALPPDDYSIVVGVVNRRLVERNRRISEGVPDGY